MIKIRLFIFFTFLMVLSSFSQVNDFVEEYNRNAFTVFVIGGDSKYTSDILNASKGIIIPDKFDNNTLDSSQLNAKSGSVSISEELTRKQIANQIIAKWFDRDSVSGEFNMSVIHERGLYNATDNEVAMASASKVGIVKLKDAGESLINRSYILVMEFRNIQSMRQVYNKRDVAKRAAAEALNKNYQPVRRVKNGWIGDVKGYLYKLDFNDSLINVFYNDLWIYQDDSDSIKALKKSLFGEIELPIKYIGEAVNSVEGTQYNAGHPMAAPKQLSRNQLFERMLNSGLDACIFQMERLLESFKVKTPVYNTKPIRAKIGKKEGLKTDQRFFAIESYQNAKGEMKSRRKGVVRAGKIIDNRKVASGNSTEMSNFYQTAGRKIRPGMVLHQRNDFGIGMSGGLSFGEIGGGWGKIEYNVSRASGLPITQLKFFAYMGIENKTYTMDNSVFDNSGDYRFYFNRIQVGLSKGFYFARNLSLAPFVSYGAETGQSEAFNRSNGMRANDFIGTDFLNFGASGSINLLHNVQIVATFNYYTPLWYTYTKQRSVFDYSIYQNKSYTWWFDGRRNMSIDAGIRIEF